MSYTRVKNAKELIAMRQSGRILSDCLKDLSELIKPGVTGIDLDEAARQMLKKTNATPAFLGYQGFPKVLCVSVNDAVVHGIPNSIPFKDGDVVSIDFGVVFEGMITDAARSVIAGEGEKDVVQLVGQTSRSLSAGIEQLRNGVRVGDIASAIEKVLSAAGLGIVRDLVGHGVGHELHEDPNIPNYGHAGTGPALKSGMTIAIEPMATLGSDSVFVDDDGWTIRTQDGVKAAHFEDTILITDSGFEVLTNL